MRFSNALLAGAASLSLLICSVAASADVRVNFRGCVFNGPEPGCLGVRLGHTSYDITGTKPAPHVREAIAGTGLRTNIITSCQIGPRLAHVQWHQIRMYCPPVIIPKRK